MMVISCFLLSSVYQLDSQRTLVRGTLVSKSKVKMRDFGESGGHAPPLSGEYHTHAITHDSQIIIGPITVICGEKR